MNIKYLEFLDFQPGSIFKTDTGNIVTNIFSAIILCDRSFDIINPNSLGVMPYFKGTIRQTKEFLGRFAFIKTIELTKEKDAIAFEYFSLEIPSGTIDFSYDYSFMYDEEIDDIPSNSKVFYEGKIFEAWLYPIASSETMNAKSRNEYLDMDYVYNNNVYAHYFLDNATIDHKDDAPMYRLIPVS